MRAYVEGLLTSQGGVFARGQAMSMGFTHKEFVAMTRRGGPWLRVRYGVYTTRSIWDSLDGGGRAALCDRAALLVCAQDAVLSHSSAARMHGMALCETDDGLSHVTRTDPAQTSRVEAGIKHHCAHLPLELITRRDELRVTTRLRTALDIAREFGFRSGLVSADSALHAGESIDALRVMAQELTTEPHGPTMLAVAARADGRAENPLETLSRELLVAAGFSDVVPQYPILLSTGKWVYVDHYSPRLRHAFESDGRLKYQEQLDSRGRRITPDEVVWLEKKREDLLRGDRHGVSRIIWQDTHPDNFQRVRERLWAEVMSQAGQRRTLPPSA